MTEYNLCAESIIPKKDAQRYDDVLRQLSEHPGPLPFAKGGVVEPPKHNHLTRVVLQEKGKCPACDYTRSKWGES